MRYGAPSDPLDLLLLRRLDREQAATHRLLVEAWDGGIPRRSGRLQVELQVLDESDNAPTFGRREYRARLREDAPAGASVCRVFATDPDLGVNGEVRYALSRRQGDSSVAAYFVVGERSGLLRLRRRWIASCALATSWLWKLATAAPSPKWRPPGWPWKFST